MSDLRKAAEMALEVLEEVEQAFGGGSEWFKERFEALRQALVQPVDAVNMSEKCVHKTAKREHEPVAWVIEDGEVDYYVDVVAKIKPGTPLYTAPPKREWVGLTEAEVWDLWDAHTEQPFPEWFVDFKRAYEVIQAKLKEKNCG